MAQHNVLSHHESIAGPNIPPDKERMWRSEVLFKRARLDAMAERIRRREQRALRAACAPDVVRECDAEHLSWPKRAARLVRRMCEAEQPLIHEDENIVFARTVPTVPPVYVPHDWAELTRGRTLHELGPISNICADWGMALSEGLVKRRKTALETLEHCSERPEAVEFLESAVETIDAVLDLAGRYRELARSLGREDICDILAQVPGFKPRTFREALQSLRFLHAVAWMAGHYHVGLGRFDQYMWPYLDDDLRTGRIDVAGAEELLAEFFISLNKDTDLYPGVQQGDNGQSLMLGGVREDGSCAVNELTCMVLRVSLYTRMIDPKINLRVSKDTDPELLKLAAHLTAQGLGFPQYSNDDVVIPGLVRAGYALPDARNYTVAACWEFIIPGKGMEIVNIGAASLPLAADRAIRYELAAGGCMNDIWKKIESDIRDQVRAVADPYRRILLPPAPYYSVLMNGCLESGRDLSQGLTYNNFGIHGAAGANAADALAAVEHFVFQERSVEPRELLAALDADFQGFEALQERLACEGPKVGQNGPADTCLRRLFDVFALACNELGGNGRGGHFRAGTGSAMYYVWLSRGKPGDPKSALGATAEGRKSGEFFSANLAPSLNARVPGPISVLQSFSKIDYLTICNGGPVTLELSDSVFQTEEDLGKCASLVSVFAATGCQQLQLNTLRAETLLDAKRHPERHRNLIVRVWGWSGYFCELAPEYQDHVIARCLYRM